MAISQENKKLLTSVGIAVAAYLIVIKPLFQKLGITKTDAEIAKEKSDAANIEEVEKNLNARGVDLSKSKAEWDQIADTIYNNLRFSAIADLACKKLLRASNVSVQKQLPHSFYSTPAKVCCNLFMLVLHARDSAL